MAFRSTSTHRAAAAVTAVGCGVLVGAVLAGSATARPAAQSAAAGVITSVTFGGTPAKPVITVTGRGLGIPAPSPAVSPSNQPLCPVVIPGNAGFDYGTSFYLLAFSTVADDKFKWAAGRYRPKLSELDCIGIIVLSHTATKVRFTLGGGYKKYPPIVNSDLAEVVLRGAAFGTVVRYR